MMSSLSMQKMQLSDDPDDYVWGRWYWTRPSAKPLRLSTAYGYPLWESDLEEALVGPRFHMRENVYARSRVSPFPGLHSIGKEEWYENGLPQEERKAGQAVDHCGVRLWYACVGCPVPVDCQFLAPQGLKMAAGVKYECFVEDLAEGRHNLGFDTLKLALTNAAPSVSTHTVLSDITEISAGGGYAAGGEAITITGSAEIGGAYSLTQSADVTFTASGGSIGPFRYVVMYNETSVTLPLICYWDNGSAVTLSSGQTFTVDLAGTILTIN